MPIQRGIVDRATSRALGSGVCLLVAAAGAAAQCDWYVQNVPDFDQRRQQTGPIAGLPGDGGMYCVPTTSTNWSAYIANHGYPSVMNGARKWSSNANYNWVTNRDALMGSLMGTDPVTGTGGSGWVNGLDEFLFLNAPFKFNVTGQWSSGSSCPGTFDLLVAHSLGGLIGMSYGRYTESPAGYYTRSGGHIIALVGMKDYCAQTPTILKFRDPADDSDNTTQSVFGTASSPMTPVSAHFRGSTSDSYDTRTEFRFSAYSTPCFLDGVVVIWPVCGLTVGSGQNLVDTVQLLRPVQLAENVLPAVQSFPTPTGGNIRDLVMHPRMTSFLYITGPVGATPTKVFTLNPVNGVSTEITGFTNPSRLFVSRQGEMYVLDNSEIIEVDLDTLGQVGGPARPTTAALSVNALTFDDFTGAVVGVDPGLRSVYLWPRGLSRDPAQTLQLPPGPTITGRLSITVSRADGSLWITGQTSPAIYKLVGSGPVLSLADSIPMAAGMNQVGLNVDKGGHVLFSSNGRLVEMEKDASGVWINSPASDFAGLAAGPLFYLSKTRSNFDAATMTGPGWNNLPDPEALPVARDCYANCDGSTTPPVLNVNDFQCFLNRFAAGDPEANCDDSTAAPVLNVNDFQCFLNHFASGCP